VAPRVYYRAMRDIPMPGNSLAFAYREGQPVPPEAITNPMYPWPSPLIVGVDVMPEDPTVIPRPADDDDERAWRAYAVGQGLPYEQVRDLDPDQVREVLPPEPLPAGDVVALRPSEGARKPAWVSHAWQRVRSMGWQVNREALDDCTKAQLIDAFGPDGGTEQITDLLESIGGQRLDGDAGQPTDPLAAGLADASTQAEV
jgi:hypothetical protein